MRAIVQVFLACFILACMQAAGGETRWWKGNLHTHSLWSDGDNYPEMITEWYKTNGYHFLALSDHNLMLKRGKWIAAKNNRGKNAGLDEYLQRFGSNWVQLRTIQSTQQVRLKPLDEFQSVFEEPNRFLLIPSEEISDRYGKASIHLNAINLRNCITPRAGSNVLAVLQRNLNAVLGQRRKTHQAILSQVNHPNFTWALSVEDLAQVKGARLFEVYNGHPSVRNEGNTNHISMERMWDIALAFRLTTPGLGPLYASAVDDTHSYHVFARTNANPGRGWVVVRARTLTPEAIVSALEAGDFYASTGVALKEVAATPGELSIEVEPQDGVTYRTQFIGTLKGIPLTDESGGQTAVANANTRKNYNSEIGRVLTEVSGTRAVYRFQGNELYVRAKVISSKKKTNPYARDEVEVAWTQPVMPAR